MAVNTFIPIKGMFLCPNKCYEHLRSGIFAVSLCFKSPA